MFFPMLRIPGRNGSGRYPGFHGDDMMVPGRPPRKRNAERSSQINLPVRNAHEFPGSKKS